MRNHKQDITVQESEQVGAAEQSRARQPAIRLGRERKRFRILGKQFRASEF